MKFISIISGRAVWLFETLALNPRGFDLQPVYMAIKNRYGFSSPKNREDVENASDGIKFLNGTFKVSSRDQCPMDLIFFNDGVVAETKSSTVHADAFLEDVLTFMQKEHGLFFDPAMVVSRRHSSSLLFESAQGFSRFSEILSGINSLIKEETGRSYDVSGLTLNFDSTLPNDGLGSFMIERRAKVALALNRYYSGAPLRTDSHIRLLEKFESLMA